MAQITVTIPDELLATHQRFQTENGAAWCDSFVESKLREIAARHMDDDARAAFAQLQALPADQRASVQATLSTAVIEAAAPVASAVVG